MLTTTGIKLMKIGNKNWEMLVVLPLSVQKTGSPRCKSCSNVEMQQSSLRIRNFLILNIVDKPQNFLTKDFTLNSDTASKMTINMFLYALNFGECISQCS